MWDVYNVFQHLVTKNINLKKKKLKENTAIKNKINKETDESRLLYLHRILFHNI